MAKRARIRYPFLQNLDGDEVNGMRAYLLIAQQDNRILPGTEKTVGRAITETLHYMMMEQPGLIDLMYSPDGLLRRLREVNQACQKEGLVQPALQ